MSSGKDKLFYNVLDANRNSILDKLSNLKDDFYLADGTALALQIGHRVSVDFDFFTATEFDNFALLKRLENVFVGEIILVVQNEVNTLTILLNDEIKISFFKLEYKNLIPLIETKYFKLAKIKEIGIMKLLALFRATYKDYVDLYYILGLYSLKELIHLAEQKHPEFEKIIYIKALLSFDDVDDMPIQYINGFAVEREKVFFSIEKKTIEYLKYNTLQ